MSPSTKNLRERIEATIESITCDCGEGPCEGHIYQLKEALHALLSSELSLAVKGLRDALETPHTAKQAGYCDTGSDMNNACRSECYNDALERFNSKAKEILGESS